MASRLNKNVICCIMEKVGGLVFSLYWSDFGLLYLFILVGAGGGPMRISVSKQTKTRGKKLFTINHWFGKRYCV